jgi:hypothetical protein
VYQTASATRAPNLVFSVEGPPENPMRSLYTYSFLALTFAAAAGAQIVLDPSPARVLGHQSTTPPEQLVGHQSQS